MKENLKPVFSDITWGAGGSTAELTMEIALNMQKSGHVSKLFYLSFICEIAVHMIFWISRG